MTRSPFRIAALALIAAALGAGLALWLRPAASPGGPQSPASAPASSPPATVSTPVSGSSTTLPSTEPAPTASPAETTPPLPTGEAAQEAITELAVTYDAAAVPALARFLAHADAEIRAAARDGFLQLGERAAIPYLEAAAKTAASEEAKALREAAEYLALPTWTEVRAAREKQAAGAKP